MTAETIYDGTTTITFDAITAILPQWRDAQGQVLPMTYGSQTVVTSGWKKMIWTIYATFKTNAGGSAWDKLLAFAAMSMETGDISKNGGNGNQCQCILTYNKPGVQPDTSATVQGKILDIIPEKEVSKNQINAIKFTFTFGIDNMPDRQIS